MSGFCARRIGLMRKATPPDRVTAAPGSARTLVSGDKLGPRDVLALAAGCGLAAGWLEVGARVLCRSIDPTHRLYLMSRHFVWLVPLSNLMLFSSMGVLLAVATKLWTR